MSVVVAVLDPNYDRVHLAADAALVDGADLLDEAEKLTVVHSGGRKVVVGVAGWAGWMPMVVDAVAANEPPRDPAADRAHDRWARAIASVATEAGVEAKFTADDDRLDGSALLAVGGRAWQLDHHCALPVRRAYTAVGSGDAVALGALHALHHVDDQVDPAGWAEAAVEAAIAHVSTVGGPVFAAHT